ncbi:MAG TPA: hypothetical protein VFT34_06925, partial [Verrucomicrobiae bacterium]|nr:hypothetical protein [Verrucomicrobiae bacterium]
GFGRNLHGVVNGMNTAAFVTNFGDLDTDDQTDANDAAANLNPGATVAMEYSSIEGDATGDRVVKFYVYKNGNRAPSANLDKLGERTVPQLCMVCHGGEYPGGAVFGSAAPFNSVSDVKLGSKFLPFDLHYYKFPTIPAGFDKATQQPKFKNFNEMIVKVSPPLDPVIGDIVTQMYTPGPNQNEDFVVAGWRDVTKPVQESMYRDVIGRSCRTCHAAHSFPALNFDTASGFLLKLAAAEIRVCDNHVMPHSKVTHKLFWTSINLHQPAVFQLFGDTYGGGSGWSGMLCGNFTPGGLTPMTVFSSMIQPLFNGVNTSGASACVTCHSGGSPPAGLNLATGLSYGNIVNVNSTEVALKRVKPSDHLNSYLWHKINDAPPAVGARMPQNGPPYLNQTEIDTIKNWIDSGANP